MFTFDSYRDVLSEKSHRDHHLMIGSAWLLPAAIAIALVLFA